MRVAVRVAARVAVRVAVWEAVWEAVAKEVVERVVARVAVAPRDRARLAVDGQDLEAAREQLARATRPVLVVEPTLKRRPHA